MSRKQKSLIGCALAKSSSESAKSRRCKRLLSVEPLESRTLLSGTGFLQGTVFGSGRGTLGRRDGDPDWTYLRFASDDRS